MISHIYTLRGIKKRLVIGYFFYENEVDEEFSEFGQVLKLEGECFGDRVKQDRHLFDIVPDDGDLLHCLAVSLGLRSV